MSAKFVQLLGSYDPGASNATTAVFKPARAGVADVRAAWAMLPKMLMNPTMNPNDKTIIQSALERRPTGAPAIVPDARAVAAPDPLAMRS